MTRCEHCQAQLLDYLYDLVDREERQVLADHLAGCPDCRLALAEAEHQQHLLRTAAKVAFPAVRFEAPPAPTRELPATIPLVRTRRVSRSWGRYAAAAAILLTVGGVGVPVGIALHGDAQRRDDLAQKTGQHEQLKNDAERLLKADRAKDPDPERGDRAEEFHSAAIRELARAIDETRLREADLADQITQEVLKEKLCLTVTGPESIQPGAPNHYRIETTNGIGQRVPADLTIRVRDQTDEVIYPEQKVHSKGDHQLGLPPDIPLRPDARLTLQVTAVRDGGAKAQFAQLVEELPLATPQYLTHLTTDKAVYRPGEMLSFRSLTLDAFSHRPPTEDLSLIYALTGPDGREWRRFDGISRLHEEPRLAAANGWATGNVPGVPLAGGGRLEGKDRRESALVLGPDGKPIRGVGADRIDLPANLPEGEYRLTVSERGHRFPPTHRRFLVMRFHSELLLEREVYHPGERVKGTVRTPSASTAESKGPPIQAEAMVDGQAIRDVRLKSLEKKTAPDAAYEFELDLPKYMERGEASVILRFGPQPTDFVVHPIPVDLNRVQVEFFPEGGDLIAGVPNRVYWQARDALDRPAAVNGRVLDRAEREVARIQTCTLTGPTGVSSGLGLFTFNRAAEEVYHRVVDEPRGSAARVPLPGVKSDGVVLSVPDSVIAADEPIEVTVQSAGAGRQLLVGAYCRGRMLDHRNVFVRDGETMPVRLVPEGNTGGVYRITVFEDCSTRAEPRRIVPRAERLVYRAPEGRLQLGLRCDKWRYAAGETVRLEAEAKDEAGRPVPAIVTLGCADQRVAAPVADGWGRTLPQHFYLASEIGRPEDLEHLEVLPGDGSPLTLASEVLGTPVHRTLGGFWRARSDLALDLLLGTQGWRRFAEQTPEQFKQQFGEKAEFFLATVGGTPVRTTNVHEVAQASSLAISAKRQKLRADTAEALRANEQRVLAAVEESRVAHAAAFAEQDRYREGVRRVSFVVVAVLLVLAGVIGLAVGMVRRLPRPGFRLGTAFASASLFGLVAALCLRSALGPVQPTELAHFVPPDAKNNDDVALSKLGDARRDTKKPEGSEGGLEAGKIAPAEPTAATLPRGAFADDRGAPTVPAPAAPGGGAGAPAPRPPAATPPSPLTDVAKEAPGEAERLASFAYRAAVPSRLRGLEAPEFRKLTEELTRGNVVAVKPSDNEAQSRTAGGSRTPSRGDPDETAKNLAAKFGKAKTEPSAEKTPLPDRQFAAFKGDGAGLGGAGGFGGAGGLQPPGEPFYVRVFPGRGVDALDKHDPNRRGPRLDFAATVYWHPVLVLPNGKAVVSFDLPDVSTVQEITIHGHTLDGRLGSKSLTVPAGPPK